MASGLILTGDRVRVLTREASRELDRLCIEWYGIPGIVLMENAARAIEQVILERYGDEARVVVVCGPGNNGGDGFAVSRQIGAHWGGIKVLTTQSDKGYKGDAATNLHSCRMMGQRIEALDEETARSRIVQIVNELGEYEHLELLKRSANRDKFQSIIDTLPRCVVVVDALLGSGMTRPARGLLRECIEGINDARDLGAKVLSVDIPSGLDCDTGVPILEGPVVRADVTVTLAAMKKGFLNEDSQRFTGDVVVGNIGAPHQHVSKLEVLPERRRSGEWCLYKDRLTQYSSADSLDSVRLVVHDQSFAESDGGWKRDDKYTWMKTVSREMISPAEPPIYKTECERRIATAYERGDKGVVDGYPVIVLADYGETTLVQLKVENDITPKGTWYEIEPRVWEQVVHKSRLFSIKTNSVK